MDSILSSTTYAFIHGLGYNIKDYKAIQAYLSPIGTNSRTITVPSFSRAFIDVICDAISLGGYFCWSIRPYMLLSSDTTSKAFCTTWIVSSQSISKPYVVYLPTKVSSSLPHTIRTLSSTSIMIESGDGNETGCTIFFYVVE